LGVGGALVMMSSFILIGLALFLLSQVWFVFIKILKGVISRHDAVARPACSSYYFTFQVSMFL